MVRLIDQKLCLGARCRRTRDAPRRVAAGSRLCPGCRADLSAAVVRLPVLYVECGLLLGGSAQRRGGRAAGGTPGIPFNGEAADVRSAIIAVLASWSGLVAEQRSVCPPGRSVQGLAAFLGRHIDWLAAHSAAMEASEELARLVVVASRTAYPATSRRLAVGRCVESGCPGQLTALVEERDPPRTVEIRCEASPEHRWEGGQWLQLQQRTGQTEPAPRWLSTTDITWLWQTSPGTVYRLASEQRWRRRNRSGRTYYHGDDVAQSFSRRDPNRAGRQAER